MFPTLLAKKICAETEGDFSHNRRLGEDGEPLLVFKPEKMTRNVYYGLIAQREKCSCPLI